MSASFENAGQNVGLEIWRIENFAAVPYDKASYGKFYTGDSYIVLHTFKKNDKIRWDLHFWLGKETSQDEAGAAAMLAVELDDSLGGVPVQHREVQEYESPLFLSYFKSGIRYLAGGIASGFTHVDPDAVEKKLLQVKGKRNVRVRQVPLDINSMNKGDCFVLDAGKVIYVYMGTSSKRIERLKAIQSANQVRDQDHAGKGKIVILDEYSSGGDMAAFFNELGGGSSGDIPDEDAGGDDVDFEKTQQSVVTLYRVSDASGQLNVDKVGEKPLQQSMLKTEDLVGEDCFILDTAGSGIFVWIGKGCTRNEKLQAMKYGQQFLEEKGYPVWTKVERIVEGAETTVFKQYFASWKMPQDAQGLGKIFRQNKIAVTSSTRKAEKEFDIRSLHAGKLRLLLKSGGGALGFMPDDGTGEKEVYRVENFELAPVDPSIHGFLFGGDSYVIKYTFGENTRKRYIIYFWQGNESSQDEKAASALHAVRLDDELGGKAVQVRVAQGNEPRHFLKMFQGKMIVFMGGHASGFRNVHDMDTYDLDGTRLFHVRGSGPEDVRAVQVPEVAGSLNSDDVFVLEIPTATYIWHGKGASDEEKAMGENVAALVSPGRTPVTIQEGEEPAEFWNGLGGQGPYTTEVYDPAPFLKPRLFHCILSAQGRFRVDEIPAFRQKDLVEDDVMVLDAGREIYVWIGKDSTEEERKRGLSMAQEYLKTDPTERSPDNAIVLIVRQGAEPEGFTQLFPTWNAELWKGLKSFQDFKAAVSSKGE